MNVLYLDATRSLYGASRMLLTLLHDAPDLHVTPYAVLANDVEDDLRMCVELDRLGVRYWEYPLTVLRRQLYLNPRGVLYMARSLFGSVRFLRRLIRRYKIDLVQTNTSTILSGAIAARMSGIPHVWHIHELFREWEGRVLARMVNALSTCVVAPSEAVARNLTDAYPAIARKLVVIQNGVDPAPYRAVSQEKVGRMRSEWGIGAGEKVVGMIGRIGMWKGEEQFVEVARQVRDRGIGARFVIVGGVFNDKLYHLANLERLIAKAGLGSQVLVVGLRKDVPVVINLFDVLVHLPVRPEPFGLVAVEAMSAGKPVVAAAAGGLQEIVADGDTGYLVQQGDIAGAAEKLIDLLTDDGLRLRLGRAGSARVDACFSSEVYSRRFGRLYGKILKGLPGA